MNKRKLTDVEIAKLKSKRMYRKGLIWMIGGFVIMAPMIVEFRSLVGFMGMIVAFSIGIYFIAKS